MIRVELIADHDRAWARDVLAARWGSPMIITRGRSHQADELPGFIARIGTERVGLATYRIEMDACELVLLDSVRERVGVGSALLQAVCEAARMASAHRIWLITTNDNRPAQRFYERRGWSLAAVHEGAVERSRMLKPGIPAIGMDGIPIRDELEYERCVAARACD